MAHYTTYIFPTGQKNESYIICDGDTIFVGDSAYFSSNTYINIFAGRFLCDSIVTTTLTVLPNQFFTQNIHSCYGETISINGNLYSGNGTYVDEFIASNTCDSTLTTHLIVDDSINTSTTQTSNTITVNAGSYNYQWYDCATGLIFSGEINQTYTATENGLYACIISNSFCSDSTACVEVKGLGLSPLSIGEGQGVRLYPNPNTGTFILQINQSTTTTLYDVLGKKVFSIQCTAGKNEIDISALADGVYVLRAANESVRVVVCR